MSELGVFAVDRGVFSHPLFDDGKAFTRREAWLWLISEAAWKPRKVDRGGRLIDLNRGQLAHSIRFMADAWGWSKSSVDRFLDRLKTETMIGTEAGTGFLVVTICKYDAFQRLGLPNRDTLRDADRDTSGTAAGQTRNIQTFKIPPTPKGATKARTVDDRYGDPNDPTFADFDANVWPKRWSRKGNIPLKAFRAYAKLKPLEREACKSTIESCGRAIIAAASDERYRPLLATWINAKGWEADAGNSDNEAGTERRGPDWAKWVAAFRADATWNPTALGPAPGQPGCRVPREFLVGVAAA